MSLVSISCDDARQGLAASSDQALGWCQALELGQVLYFPQSPVALADDDHRFLLRLEQHSSSRHKNLAYCAARDRISGAGLLSSGSHAKQETVERFRSVLRSYSAEVTGFLTQFLAPYEARWQVDSTSFRPLEERGRSLPIHKRNDRMHIDAFPTRPTHGARILRFFQNIHPTQPREWIIGEPFRSLLPQFTSGEIALPQAESAMRRRGRTTLCHTAVGQALSRALPALQRSPYDRFMLRLHHFLKENDSYQAHGLRQAASFPPGSSWMVYTDTVPHAVLSGRYALEQTFLVVHDAMVTPEHAPLQVLQSLTGQILL